MIRNTCLTLALLFFGTLFVLDALFATDLLKGLFTIGFHLFLGGIWHAVASLPYAFGSVSHALWTLGALLGAFLGLHGLMILRNRKRVRWKLPQLARVFALVLLLVAGSSAAIHAARNAFRLAIYDTFIEPGRGYVAKSLSNARQLITAVRIYASEHKGRYPEHLEELVVADILDPESLANLNKAYPSGAIGAPWTFLQGLHEDAPHNVPLFVSPTSYSRDRYIVGYNDSSVSIEDAAEYEAAIQRWREYRKLHPVIGPAKAKGGAGP